MKKCVKCNEEIPEKSYYCNKCGEKQPVEEKVEIKEDSVEEAKEAEVIDIGYRALRITSLFYFGLGMIYVPRAVLNGCGDTGFAMINGITEVICRILYSEILTRIPAIGFWGVWITTGFTWGTTAIVCIIRYKRGKWKTKAIAKK